MKYGKQPHPVFGRDLGSGFTTRCSQWLPAVTLEPAPGGFAAPPSSTWTIVATVARPIAIVGVRGGSVVEQLELFVRMRVGSTFGAIYDEPTPLAVVAAHVLAGDAPRTHATEGQSLYIELRNKTAERRRVQLYMLYDVRGEQAEAFAPFDAQATPGVWPS